MHSTILDDDAVLRISSADRKIKIPAGGQHIGATKDHRSEQLTFECPRYVDGHDLAGCALKWISWTNARGEKGEDIIGSVQKDDETVRFTWLVGSGATAAAGTLEIAVHFADTDSTGRATYQWSTETCKALRVVHTHDHGPEEGVTMQYSEDDDESGLLYLSIDEAQLNAATYTEVKEALYG